MTEAELIGQWTVDTSRADLLARIIAQAELHKSMFDSLQRELTSGFASSKESVLTALGPVKEAMTKAEQANDKRFDALRQEADARDRAMTEKLNALTLLVTAAQASSAATALTQREGKTNNQWSFSAAVSVIALFAIVFGGIIGHFLK
jgi:hypothetical protein